MILTILAVLTAAALVPKFWRYILSFLNGPVRNLLERLFGADHCSWYVKFLQWADKKATATHRIIKMAWMLLSKNRLTGRICPTPFAMK